MMRLIAEFIIAILLAVGYVYAGEPADKKRLDEIAERGAHVMPFDLDKTVHVFSKTSDGGIQQVIVKDKSDSAQIRLIREHLSEISKEFVQGDFSKPVRIHGKSMPGLAMLKTADPDELKIEYLERV